LDEEEIEYDDDDISDDSEEEDEDSEDDDGDDWKKPSCTRLILEMDLLKKCIEKNCHCPKCDGLIEIKMKTLCLASNVMLCYKDVDCGYVDVSDLPAKAARGCKDQQ
jgi:hypothetical protein